MDAEGYAIKTMVAVDLRLGGADGGRRHGGCASSAPSGGARHFEICPQQLFPDARCEAARRIWRNGYRRSNCLRGAPLAMARGRICRGIQCGWADQYGCEMGSGANPAVQIASTVRPASAL